jgi:hypothetical protein
MDALIVPDIVPYLAGLLALLVAWEYHQILVLKGRIQAIDIFDRSGIRMYIHVAPSNNDTCSGCQDLHRRVFLPSLVAKRLSNASQGHCTHPGGCRCLLIGLYGAWPEGRHLVERLRTAKRKPVKLNDEELLRLINGPWEQSVSAETDRISVQMLEALSYELSNPDTSIMGYRYVIDHAKQVRDLQCVLPSFMRMADLLIAQRRHSDALELIDRFEKRYARKKTGPLYPTEIQRGLMALKKARLIKALPSGAPVAA